LKITKGNAILNLDKLPAQSSFKVETPTAIAAVRGTQFWGRVEASLPENPVTTFAVRQGTVEIFAKSVEKTFTLEAGQALDIPAVETTVPVIRPALEGEMAAMAQADSIRTAA
ncbi:MAG TPA: FecR domain-containing protein, partial [Candidatus Omnitrophota bacterium]|nr:FecR domain-containing protein [Candidatus Omnitrophota bacterium]